MQEDLITRVHAALRARLWQPELSQLSPPHRWLLLGIRLLRVVGRDLGKGELNLRAMSLVYTTLLSMVPLLALSFSVLKGFGVHHEFEPALRRLLEPLGPEGGDLASQILDFVSRMDVSVLGGLGLALLVYTVLGLLHKVESAFNHAWRISRTRGFGQRFSSYLSVVLVGPVLVFGALAITASVTNHRIVQWILQQEPFGFLLVESAQLLPLLMIAGAFTFLYLLVPNTRVDWRAAAGGGFLAGLAWQTTGWGFATFIASSSQYAAIYSGFAILILLLIWIYLSWLILLTGAQVAFYLQFPRYLSAEPDSLNLSLQAREHLALSLMAVIAAQHHQQSPARTVKDLGEALGVEGKPLEQMVDLLVAHGCLAETGDDPPHLLLAHDTSVMSLNTLFDLVRASGGRLPEPGTSEQGLQAVARLVAELETARRNRLSGMTLRDLL